MISVGNNKAVICKGDFHPAALYKGDKKIAGYIVESFENENGVTLENCYNDKLHSVQIFGNSIQDGTPTPEAPIEVQSVGELVTEGEFEGKYKVSISVSGDNAESRIFDIYLNEPLRKLGEYADYIDFEKGVVVRKIRERTLRDIVWWKQSDCTDYNSGITLYRYERGIDDKRLFIGGLGSKEIVLCSGLKNTVYANAGILDKTISERPNSAGSRNLRILTSQYDTYASMKEAYGDFKIYYILDDAYITEEPIELPKLPTFKGTTIYEIATDVPATISGKYKKVEA